MSLKSPPAFIATLLVALLATPAWGAAGDPGRDRQWALDAIGAPAAWARGAGAGITIAVIDTGVDVDHEDLAGKLVPGRNFIEPGAEPRDDHGHGTHVSGVAAAATGNGKGIAGVAPDARIMPVRALARDCAPTESCSASGTERDLNDGIRWAADNGAHVVNMSFGDDVLLRNVLGSSFRSAIEYAWTKGAIPVISAGNDSASSGYGDVHALVVVATARNGDIAPYSNSSGGLLGNAMWGISAPGGDGSGPDGDIFSTYWRYQKTNQYAYSAGTSMAVPHVAGAAAVLRSLGLTQQQTVDRLLSTARDLGAKGRDPTFGHGLVDLARATEGLGRPAIAARAPTAPPVRTSRQAEPRSATNRPVAPAPVAPAPAAEATANPVVPATTGTPAPAAPSPLAAAPPDEGAGRASSSRALVGAGLLVLIAGGGLAVRRFTGR